MCVTDDLEEPESTAQGDSGYSGPALCCAKEADPLLEQARGYATASTIFGARRKTTDAWGGGSFNLSAGWVSDIDLYRFCQRIPGAGDSDLAERELMRPAC